MSPFKLSPYVTLEEVKKKYYATDSRTGDRYRLSYDEWGILTKASHYTSADHITRYRGTLKQIRSMALVQKLLHIGALISDDNLHNQNGPFTLSEQPGMFGVKRSKIVKGSHPQIAFLGLPWDLRSGSQGAAAGPQVLRHASQHYQYALSKDKKSLVGFYSYRYGKEILERVQIIDLGDAAAPLITDYESIEPVIAETIIEIRRADAFPVFIGGDHGLTYLILRSVGTEPFALIHIDAHDDYSDKKELNHGTYIRFAARLKNLRSIHMAGIRGVTQINRGRELERSGIQHLTAEAWRGGRLMEYIDRIPMLPIYISLDIDVIDPAYAPGTFTPRGSGVTPTEVIELLGILALRHKILGLDLMEVTTPKTRYDYTPHYAIEALLHFLHDLLSSNNVFHAKERTRALIDHQREITMK